MDRRTFLKSSGIAAATASGTVTAQQAVAANAEGADHLEITTALGPQFQTGYLRDRADRLALSIKTLSNDRIILNFVATEAVDAGAVGKGELLGYFGTEADHLKLDPSLAFFAGLPGDLGLTPSDYNTWLSAGGGQMHWDAISADYGIKSFAAGHSGLSAGLWSGSDLVLLEHVKGKQMFASGLTARVGERLGFERAARADAADAIEVPVGATAAIADNVIGQSKFWFANGLAPSGQVLSFGLNREFWERLSEPDKVLIETCTSEAYHQCVSEHAAHDREVAPVLLAHRGIERRQWQDEMRRAIAHLSEQVVAEVAETNKRSRDLYENYMFYRQSVTGHREISNSVGLV